MHKAVIINSDYQNHAPTAKEMQAYLNKTGKLLYGNDKRKSANTPYQQTIHLVTSAFGSFEEVITGAKRDYQTVRNLYVLDDKVNEMHFFLKYAGNVQCHFKLNDQIIDEMHHCSWSLGHLKRHKQSVENDASSRHFFIEKNIGNKKLHNAFPAFVKATESYVLKIDNAIQEIEDKATALFTSGW